MAHGNGEVLVSLRDVVHRRSGATILDRVSWTVRRGERWVVLGPNGAGKSTVLRFAGARELPYAGEITLLGHRVGSVDLRNLRRRMGYLSPELVSGTVARLRPTMTALDTVLTGIDATLAPWRRDFDDDERSRARDRLDAFGCGHLAGRAIGTLSEGERQRVLLARATVADPDVLLLDEPSARLDVVGREHVVRALADLDVDERPAALVIVTHHLEEVPPGFTHALLLAGGRVVAAGPMGRALTDDCVSATFGAPLTVAVADGRRSARLRER